MKFTVQLCSGCLRKVLFDENNSISAVTNDTCAKIQQLLASQAPEDQWRVETTSCFRFCPERKISYSLIEPEKIPRGPMAMSTFHSAEDFPTHFVQEILRRKSYAPKS